MLTKHCTTWLANIFSIIALLKTLLWETIEKVQQDFCISRFYGGVGSKSCTDSYVSSLGNHPVFHTAVSIVSSSSFVPQV